VLEHVVLVARLDEHMRILIGSASRDVFVEIMCADEARALVARRDSLDEIESRQIEPAVVVSARMFSDEEHGVANVRRLAEDDAWSPPASTLRLSTVN
jgi:hypothetical protein